MAAERADTARLDEIARMLDDAWENGKPIPPLSDTDPYLTPDLSYDVQTRWDAVRAERGERVIGRKIGLTSKAMQEQMGVGEPDYGNLWSSRSFPAVHGAAVVPADVFIQPRLEGEIAFLMGRELPRGTVTAEHVMAAADALAVAVEIVDSRITDWKIKLVDTIADNSSYGGLTLGPWSRALLDADLAGIAMSIARNGEAAAGGVGADALGHPARAVAWLANKLRSFGVDLQPGDVVLSGSLGRALPAARGDTFVLETTGQPDLSVTFG